MAIDHPVLTGAAHGHGNRAAAQIAAAGFGRLPAEIPGAGPHLRKPEAQLGGLQPLNGQLQQITPRGGEEVERA
jgi:hypothetical protein